MTEFEIIRRYFANRGVSRADVVVGIGDDGAVTRLPADSDLVTVVDTLVAGVHFPPQTLPEDVGYKALAVNLSDMAAMGAAPAWATLALSLPQVDHDWLERFAGGFFELARRFGVQLIGGDTTRGPLTVTVQVQGFVPGDRAVQRAGARPGDLIYVTGTIGDAGLALRAWQLGRELDPPHGDYLSARLHRPTPRCEEGIALRDVASAMIDVSDGLAADLGHILQAQTVGATLDIQKIPLSESFVAVTSRWSDGFSESDARSLALISGDDYELCFTVPAARQHSVEKIFSRYQCGCRAIGMVEKLPGLRLRQADGGLMSVARGGYEHFAADPANGCG